MRDARWRDVLQSARSAARYFGAASRILRRDNFDDRTDAGYDNVMAFFHSMQSGHTAVEDALLRVMRIIGEEEPTGDSWHADLISRCAAETVDRPTIISQELAKAMQETRGFRHRATHATVRFDIAFSKERSQRATAAGELIAKSLEPEIVAFANIVDPI